uniref:CCHC-type domain-containing protein n=1 Tax=Tanacetum cinerariifolium TaxID=118510 RepID=A0A6L2LVT8_TANCI|nr:hypothetical protein [Tanacetum cinerariifolium]
MTIVITTEDMQKRRNDVKARTTLLFALLDEHQLRFSKYETAQELWEAILKTFGGNEATKKTKKNQLKQQYGNFKAEGLETLEQTFNRLGKGKVHTASVPTASIQIKYEDITQIDEDDIEETDIKCNMALLSMRADRFWKKTGKRITIQGSNVAGFDKSKVECFNCHKIGHFSRECRAPRSQDRGKRESYKQANEEENHALVDDDEVPTEFALMAKSSSSSKNEVESRLVEFKEQETKFYEKIRGLERDVEVRNNKIEYLMNELEQVKKEKEGLDNKLTSFESASKYLDNLLRSQRLDKNKEGLGYTVVPPPPA